MQDTASNRTDAPATPRAETAPRYAWRGYMLDVSRHFFTADEIRRTLDLMHEHGLNVFHWHLTDGSGWRLQIDRYPKLTTVGAVRKASSKRTTTMGLDIVDGDYGPFFYTKDEVRGIVAYAAERGIRVVPEIEIPGHSGAAIGAYPELGCAGRWNCGEYCLGKESTFEFLRNVLDEVVELFPDEVVHIGGDECAGVHWKDCPDCQARIRELGLKDAHDLQGWATKRFADYLAGKGRRLMGWDELATWDDLPRSVIVQSYRGASYGVAAAKKGFDVVMSPDVFCYLDYVQGLQDDPEEYQPFGVLLDVAKIARFDPCADVPEDCRRHILGGQGNLWTELVPDLRGAEWRTWPRLAAIADVLRNGPAQDVPAFLDRMRAIREDLVRRGVNAAPLGPLFNPVPDLLPGARYESLKADNGKRLDFAKMLDNPLDFSVLRFDLGNKDDSFRHVFATRDPSMAAGTYRLDMNFDKISMSAPDGEGFERGLAQMRALARRKRGGAMEFTGAVIVGGLSAGGRRGPWTKEKAWAWHDAQPWLRGCNYMPAGAANRVDQWQSRGSAKRFAEMEREMALAEEVGFNAMRLLILEEGFCVWLDEHDAFMANFERTLSVMAKHGIRAVVVFGNDCSRPKSAWTRPRLGVQSCDAGYHGGRRRTQHGGFDEPGYLMVDEPEWREKFYGMCREILSKYAADDRVAVWNLWNEPGAGNRGDKSAPILRGLFELAWEIDPKQPLCADTWSRSLGAIAAGGDPAPIEKLALDLSDVVSYHGYCPLETQAKVADALAKTYGRPLLNTEWLLRGHGCEFADTYAFLAQRKIGSFNWGFVNGKYQTHEPYEPMWTTKFDYRGGDPTRWFHDLFRISHHPWDPYEIAVARNVNAWADLDAKGESLRAKIARSHKIAAEDMWYGYRRTKFDFGGREAWIVEPSVAPADGMPWTWTMQWAEAFVDRTGVLDLLRRGFHHATIDLFDTRMDETGLEAAAAFQTFLVEELGFAPKANLVGLSWGGFFSTRYAAARPENVRRIYLDAPLLNFDGFGNPDYGRVGVWADRAPADGAWTADPEMPVNKAAAIARAKIPVLLVYGGCDTIVPPERNCRLFAERFRAAGGELREIPRDLFGHHPHGLDPGKTQPIVDFFA